MPCIAINEYDNDWPIAVVQIPEGKTADETFVMWYRQYRGSQKNLSDQQILELPFAWEELEVLQVS